MNRQRIHTHEKWKHERRVGQGLKESVPLFKKLEEKHKAVEEEREHLIKMKNLEERRNKLKPILNEEIKEFGQKVDTIVSYLTRKRQEQRIESNLTDFDPNRLKS
jgi:predicted patatin/cPLA2 family phospholipase